MSCGHDDLVDDAEKLNRRRSAHNYSNGGSRLAKSTRESGPIGGYASEIAIVSSGNGRVARSGHSTMITDDDSTISSHPSPSSSPSFFKRYKSACTIRPRGAAYSCRIANVGLVTAAISATPNPRQIARASVVFPAPRSPRNVMTARAGSAAPKATPHCSSWSSDSSRRMPAFNSASNDVDVLLLNAAFHSSLNLRLHRELAPFPADAS